MTFARPDLLWLTALLPALAALGVYGYFLRRRRVARRLGESGLVARLGGAELARFPTRRLLLIAPAALLIALAAAGPQWGSERVETHGRALNLALALDVSKSMLARDLAPSRLERERLLATRLLRELRGDRIGLVAFAGRAYTLAPLTTDHSALQLYVDALDPEIVSQGGSSLALAITQATDLVRGEQRASRDRVVVLMTDGEALEEEDAVLSAAKRAASFGVVIHTVGIATPAGAPVPELEAGVGHIVGYKRDPDTGETVISRLGDKLLERVARETSGRYVRIDQAGATDRLLAEIRGMERTAAVDGTRLVPKERFAWFIALALLLLSLDAVFERSRPIRRAPVASRGAVLALLLVPLLAFGIGDVERGNRYYRQGRYGEAVEAYQKALAAGDTSSILRYNLGTALLRLGRFDEAEQHLRAALRTLDPEMRERTQFNLGNRFLDAGRATNDPRLRQQWLDAAVEAYRDALRLDPADRDAKWNLELALREKEQPPPSQGGGGEQQQQDPKGEQGEGGGGGGEGDQQAPAGASGENGKERPRDPGALSQAQAERILSAVEQGERDLYRSKLRKGRRETPVARDW
jgi:Ca-activated chloride channel family protein